MTIQDLIDEMNKPVELNFMNVDVFIKQHKHIQYCEAIISPTGLIAYAEPSHIQALASTLGCMTEDEMYALIPPNDSPIEFLLEASKHIAVWYNLIMTPTEITSLQKRTISKLIKADVVSALCGIILENKLGISIIEVEQGSQEIQGF